MQSFPFLPLSLAATTKVTTRLRLAHSDGGSPESCQEEVILADGRASNGIGGFVRRFPLVVSRMSGMAAQNSSEPVSRGVSIRDNEWIKTNTPHE
jgi:hypothetical protein